jgi:hypothetical protein
MLHDLYEDYPKQAAMCAELIDQIPNEFNGPHFVQ